MTCICPNFVQKLFVPKMSNNVVENEFYHMGHLITDCLLRKPEAICQIDGATDEKETCASVLSRTKRLAKTLKTLGLKPGDVLVLGGRNHLNLHIPHYAGLLNGYPICGVDPLYKFDEIKKLFEIVKPKVAFCELEDYDNYSKASQELGLHTKIFTFREGENNMKKLIESAEQDVNLEPAQIDNDKVYAWLVCTSGTTGSLKIAAFKHQTCMDVLQYISSLTKKMRNDDSQQSSAVREAILNVSPLYWVSGFFNAVGPLINEVIKVQTSAPLTADHIIDVINKYKPILTLTSPSLAVSILQSEKHCDLTCFNSFSLAGGKVFKDVLSQLQSRLKKGSFALEAYGCTECLGVLLWPNPLGPAGNCGRPMSIFQVMLVDPETGKEITEPDVPGEMWLNGPRFTEYYNNPEETKKALTEDGWYKTGDLLRRDREGNYYFVERLKMLIKYRNYHIVPPELEEVILKHEGVAEVAVTSIPHLEDGERPVACVVRHPGSTVAAQEIKDLVASKLSDPKQLRGGVVFLAELPMTSSGKIARAKLQKIAQEAKRE